MTRRRDTTTDTIPAMLAAVDRVILALDGGNRDSAEDATPDCHWVWTFITEAGQRMGVEREQLEGKADGWPLVGKYEADYVDSEGESQLDGGLPFTATQFDPEVLKELAKNGGRGGGGDSFAGITEQLLSTARIENRNLALRAEREERRADKARAELETKIDTIGKLQKEKNDAIMAKDKAVADKDLSDAKRAEAEESLEFLENQLASMKPHVAMAVDRLVERGMEAFGGMALPETSAAGNGRGAPQNGAARVESNGAAHVSPPPAVEPDGDPPPPFADDPSACMEDLLAACVFDPEVARELHTQGILSWETIRALVWLKSRKDLGPDPTWGDEPTEDAPPGPPERPAPAPDPGGP